ncbi:TIGR04255 family protein [Nostoc sp. ChiSLP03a]|uniref:TIGR04255 family protein n=1 Tax=Nostoc sp. ChiSLP03a TaxID=3075380 RepID=UPI002AD2AB93|nr:TIGR04255 family protein [Nostoc sp. ChiSLP03a]MDZ8211268.1 TIGR04255 family protein [Nostoc sp. ChiSLP03a]
MTRRQYPNPPIEEAVCEFRFAPGPVWNFTIPGLFYEKIRDFYTGEPQRQTSIETEFQVRSQSLNPELTVRPGWTKLLLPSADANKLVAVVPDLVSVHALRPYEGWDEFKQRIDRAFDVYVDVAKPVGVTRIALRYINQIAIPTNLEIELSDYFTIYPQVPADGIPSRMSAFLTRTELIYEDIPIRLVLNFSDAVSPPGKAGQVVIVLDLEISQEWVEKPLPLEEALSTLYELRQREGQAFESLITDRTRELFDVIE